MFTKPKPTPESIEQQIKMESDRILRELRGTRRPFTALLFDEMRCMNDDDRRDQQRAAHAERLRRAHQQIATSGSRADVNAYLRRHGYAWQKREIGTEDNQFAGGYSAGIGEYSHSKWTLYAQDGRAVTVSQALAEIEENL